MARSPRFYRWFSSCFEATQDLFTSSWNGSSVNGVWGTGYPIQPVGGLDSVLERTRYTVTCSIFLEDSPTGSQPLEPSWPLFARPVFALPVFNGPPLPPPTISSEFGDTIDYVASEMLEGPTLFRTPDGPTVGQGVLATWSCKGNSEGRRFPAGGYPPVPHTWFGLNPTSSVAGYVPPVESSYISFSFSLKCLFSKTTAW